MLFFSGIGLFKKNDKFCTISELDICFCLRRNLCDCRTCSFSNSDNQLLFQKSVNCTTQNFQKSLSAGITTPASLVPEAFPVFWQEFPLHVQRSPRKKVPDSSASAISAALSAASFATVRMVPSFGFITALYAVSTPFSIAAAIATASSSLSFLTPLVKPRRSWERITPEFPLAPRKRTGRNCFCQRFHIRICQRTYF